MEYSELEIFESGLVALDREALGQLRESNNAETVLEQLDEEAETS